MRIGYAVGYWKQGPPKGALKARGKGAVIVCNAGNG